MSISSSLSSALSGLTASARAAELVSSNVANALTEGYVRRDIQLTARQLGGTGQGVQVIGVSRNVDQVLMSDRRIAEAGSSDRDARAAFLSGLESILGTSESAGSLSGRISSFDSSLIEAASRPESEARLTNVLGSARALVDKITTASDAIQTARASADDQIETQVDTLNTTLNRVVDMNIQIRASTSSGRDPSALMDQRQQLIDQISTIVPLREVDRQHGMVALYTTGGAVLLDGKAAEFGFTPVGTVTPDMTLASGALSGLTMNGRAMKTGDDSMLAGGSLLAQFAIRDDLAPEAQTRLDALARDLVDRFSDPAVDTSLAPGAPGLFTDGGSAFLPANEVGLSKRLLLNAAVDPKQGGGLWRLRDGIGAIAPGVSGNSALLSALQSALSNARTPASGFASGPRSFAALNGDMVSGIATARLNADAESSFSSARALALKEQELSNGVDTDQEMQKLLLIEQAYSANARVVQTVDDMIQTLLGI